MTSKCIFGSHGTTLCTYACMYVCMYEVEALCVGILNHETSEIVHTESSTALQVIFLIFSSLQDIIRKDKELLHSAGYVSLALCLVREDSILATWCQPLCHLENGLPDLWWCFDQVQKAHFELKWCHDITYSESVHFMHPNS